jgi:hypothetical protein
MFQNDLDRSVLAYHMSGSTDHVHKLEIIANMDNRIAKASQIKLNYRYERDFSLLEYVSFFENSWQQILQQRD